MMYRREYAAFQEAANLHRLRSEHLATRLQIFADNRQRNEKKIAEHESEIARLQDQIAQAADAKEEVEDELGPDVKAWKIDQKTQGKWDAYFDLEVDKLDV